VAFLIKKLPLSMTLRQASNNLNRRKSRLALTGITLTSAVAAFMGVTAVGISLTNVINDVFERLQYEILIVPNELLAVEKIQETIESVDGVALASPGTVVPVELGEDYLNFFTASNQIVVYGLDPQSGIFKFDLVDGDGWNNDPGREGVVISTGLSDQLGLEAGDKLTFSVRGEPIELPIIGVDSLAFDSMWVRWQELSERIGLVSPQIGGIGGQPLSNGYYILLRNSDPTVAQVDDTIEQISGALLEKNITIQEVRNQVEQSEETTRFINQNIGILNLAAALIALVGGIGLLATLSMAVFERQKEIGVMRAIGGTSQVIAFQFLIEGLAVGLISWIIAIPISYGLALVINQTLNLETIKFVYPLDVLALGLGGMMIIATIASIGPSIGAARKTVSSILRYR
jgi:putative ABC transport system permease protein